MGLAVVAAGFPLVALAPSAWAYSTPRAFVVNELANTVTPIDTASGVAGSPIPVGNGPLAIAITPLGGAAYVVNGTDGTVTPITTSTGATLPPIHVGLDPDGIAITPDGNTAYVTNYGDGTVTPIDLVSGVADPAFFVGPGPIGIAITPDGSTAFVVDNGNDLVARVALSPGGGHMVSTIGLTNPPYEISITPDGSTLYVRNGDAITAINVASGAVGASVIDRQQPVGIAINPNGDSLYVVNAGDDTVTPINLPGGSRGARIPVGAEPVGAAFTPDGGTAFVTNFRDGTVTPVATATGTAGSPIALSGEGVSTIAITPDESPEARFSSARLDESPTTIEFDASASIGTTSPVASYRWDFGDGTTVNTSSPTYSYTYADAACRTVTLTVTDAEGTSTTQVFTGQTLSRNGASVAAVSHQVCSGAVGIHLVFYCTAACFFAPGPEEWIDPASDLPAATSVDLEAVLFDAKDRPMPGQNVMLDFASATDASASVGNVRLGSTPTGFRTDSQGGVKITYTTGAKLPATGRDSLSATFAAPHGKTAATDAYTYTAPSAYDFLPVPIAAPGTLKPGEDAQSTLAVSHANPHNTVPVGGALVYLYLSKNGLGGSASVDGETLTAKPMPFLTDSRGNLTLAYTAGSGSGSRDILTAVNNPNQAALSAIDSYSAP